MRALILRFKEQEHLRCQQVVRAAYIFILMCYLFIYLSNYLVLSFLFIIILQQEEQRLATQGKLQYGKASRQWPWEP